MTPFYFQFLQTVAAFIVQAVKIDANKDGKVSGSEISTFFFAVLFPLITNANSLKDQFNGFVSFIKGIGFESFKQSLLDVIALQLLPDELKAAEKDIDRIAQAIFGLIEAIEEVVDAFKDTFGNKVLEIRIVKKK